MRLAARVKSGFYPAAPDAVRAVCSHISSVHESAALLDPCAGEGEALEIVATELCIPHSRVWACELENGRHARLAERLPGANVIGPVDSLAADISRNSVSVLWLNPPYDTEEGGGLRTEMRFVHAFYNRLVPEGVIMLSTVDRNAANAQFMEGLSLLFYDMQVFTWPGQRRFNEVTIVGYKREKPLAKVPRNFGLAERGTKYDIPAATGPAVFKAHGYTNQQVCELLSSSPLMDPPFTSLSELDPVAPMDAKAGHMALLLSGGYLDGVVQLPGEEPHVVRGSARKVRSQVNQTEEEQEDGGVKRVTTIAERIQITVRTVDLRGKFRELSSDAGIVIDDEPDGKKN